ncbi:MAG TPA: electron transfer flavoprotein subunit alpha/FixB family protein [Candidatus Nitrosotenuis sp.]|nr:electron transfer flavoprotein subunit alpha/FixB family protein [Candidatus Nitrosotenuis sp.]
MTEGDYRHVYVVMEVQDGKLINVSLEMLGEARRLFDKFNKQNDSSEKVVAILLGQNIKDISESLIRAGADTVVVADNPDLKEIRNTVYTKVISQMARDKELAGKIEPKYADQFKLPRYMFFAADSIGRHLSSTVLAELEAGLASDINKLEISDLEITHQQKTNGKPVVYKKTLEMYRPDFSGFLWTTILCLDNINPAIARDYHPQSCSIIPGVFEPITPDEKRKGAVIEYVPKIDQNDLRVKVLSRKIIKSQVDFDSHKAVVSFGRGIKESPEQNIKLIERLAKEVGGQIGVSLPISKKPFSVSQSVASEYMIPDRVIGTSGRKISPLVYFAVGISGAMQHVAGMKDSAFVVAINPDTEAPIKGESDIFIKGRLEDVIPLLIEEFKAQSQAATA